MRKAWEKSVPARIYHPRRNGLCEPLRSPAVVEGRRLWLHMAERDRLPSTHKHPWWVAMLSVRLPEDIERRLAEVARKTGRTKTYYVREAILMHLEEIEDIYLAEERLSNPARRWTHSDLEAGVDMER